MQIRFPYLGVWFLSQNYSSNPPSFPYPGGHHGAWDIVPLDHVGGNFWPAPIFPVANGKTISIANVSTSTGKGIGVETVIDASLIAYFKTKEVIPLTYNGSVTMHHLYWHMLQVTDLDTEVNENISVGITGNTGDVFSGGLPVPDNEKGIPPYPGAHLHFEYYLFGDNNVRFNLDKDYAGRIDPEILFNYKGNTMEFVQITASEFGLEYTTEFVTIVVKFTSPTDALEKLKNIPGTIKPDGTIDYTKARKINL